MNKRKVQIVIYYTAQENVKQFLLLRTNKRRGCFWQNVTGGVEKNESFKEGALREVQEETGIQNKDIEEILDLEMDFNFTDQWKNEVIEKVFSFKIKNKIEIQIDSSEHKDFKWESEIHKIQQLIKFSSNLKAILEVEKKIE